MATYQGHIIYNPAHNSMVYEVEFPDREVREYTANVIAENMLSQVDHEGYSTTLMAGIIDYKKDEQIAYAKGNAHIIDKNSRKRQKKTTKG